MQLHDLLAATAVLELVHDRSPTVTDVVHDSRAAAPGTLFACIPGRRSDGHDHAGAAVDAGSVALLVERVLPLAVTQARVASVRVALGPIAARLHGDPSSALTVLGVTGTNGKTTTTFLLRSIGAAAGRTSAALGTLGLVDGAGTHPTGFTTPEATDLQRLLARLRDGGSDVVAMEVSSHALAEHRVDGTRFAAVCYTNLGTEHLDLHGTVDEYLAVKARLFTAEFAARAAINVDDRHGDALATKARAGGLAVTTFGMDRGDADVRAEDVRPGLEAVAFRLVIGGERTRVALPLVGRFNVTNALAAAATATAIGIDAATVVAGLAGAGPVPGRFERVGTGPVTVVVDYAHTPDGIAAVVAAARELTGGRVVTVFGCGGDRDPEKRPGMGVAAGRGSDEVILTTDNPRSEAPAAIAAAAAAGLDTTGVTYHVELDRRAAIRAGIRAAAPGDVVLVLGKGAETGQEIGETHLEFDDRVVAREELIAAWS